MFYNIFTNLCKEKGLSPTATLQKLNVSTSKLTAWKKGSLPSASILILLSEFFEVSIDYLLIGKETTYDEQFGTGNIHTGNVNNSIIGGHDNKVSGTQDNDKSNDSLNGGIYFELINYLESLSASKRRHALADLIDVLEENYPL
ncbi:MAG: helix-turn-helix domain-containing protein [Ruminococcus sp.]|nr:helix-turn-helix domain-containing protein [Ruminococcus sp.]